MALLGFSLCIVAPPLWQEASCELLSSVMSRARMDMDGWEGRCYMRWRWVHVTTDCQLTGPDTYPGISRIVYTRYLSRVPKHCPAPESCHVDRHAATVCIHVHVGLRLDTVFFFKTYSTQSRHMSYSSTDKHVPGLMCDGWPTACLSEQHVPAIQ